MCGLPRSYQKSIFSDNLCVHTHLKNRGLNPDEFDLSRIVAETQGMVGRQIRNLVQAAMHRPFREQRNVTTEDMLEALKSQRQGVREFAGVQARPASSANLPVPQAARKRTVRMSSISNN
jgi:hypothetical protein